MIIVTQVFICIVALLHCLFFKIESIDFMKPKILKKFNLSTEDGKIVKIWALNQGYYNLFLAFGLFYSLVLLNTEHYEEGRTLSGFILMLIFSAGAVLLISAPHNRKAALIQGVPSIIGLILLLIS